MKYELRFTRELRDQVVSLVVDCFPNRIHADTALDELFRLLTEIAQEPHSHGTAEPGPYTGLIGVHRIEVDGVGYWMRIAYRVDEDEKAVEIHGLKLQVF